MKRRPTIPILGEVLLVILIVLAVLTGAVLHAERLAEQPENRCALDCQEMGTRYWSQSERYGCMCLSVTERED
jgi:hypothetical protein